MVMRHGQSTYALLVAGNGGGYIGVLMCRLMQGYSYAGTLVGSIVGHNDPFCECMNLHKNVHSFCCYC
ncbi:hypothetical protein OCF65_08475 [Bacillus toyonensis]|uniref:hypothetical protein n=1 Tax=Bacillus toyonensis TaxID=155322 RepID=UPI0021D3C952|nr:hypothetical protein [Bacillus toyonensis]MCU5580523.1 hypothetical protein [Bacillus toyonensis]